MVGATTAMVVAAFLLSAASSTFHHGEEGWSLPNGFRLEKVAGPDQIRYPMFAALDDEGRLFVAESSGGNLYEELREQRRRCRIVVLTDTNGDGYYDHSRTFAENLAFPMGIAWHRGRVFVADPPYLISLQDTNGDGRADRRDVLLEGFGARTNGSLHGPTVGPDGRLYMTIGWPDGYRLRREDGTWLEGSTGAVLRSRLDGSEVEVVALGMENPIEVAWTETGEPLVTNNWHTAPRDGMRDALLHLVEGGIYPRHFEPIETRPLPHVGPPLPALVVRPAVAHSGMVVYESEAFPEHLRGVFVAEFNTRRVARYTLERYGSSFRGRVESFLKHSEPTFRPSDVLEAHDGSLLVVDTGVWYVEHCPEGRLDRTEATGGIWRIRYVDSPMADPRGERMDWVRPSPGELAARLGDPRPAVRRRAAHELESRAGNEVVEAVAKAAAGDGTTALRAVWVLARLESSAALGPLHAALRSADSDVVAAAARALGGRGDRRSAPELERLLENENAHVRLAAAEALGRLASSRSAPALLQALAVQDPDPPLEHALAQAVFRTADTAILRGALNHEHARVQKTALYLLNDRRHRALEPADVGSRTMAEVPEVRRAALEIFLSRPEWADHAVTLMERWARPDAGREEWLQLAEYARSFAFHEPAARLVAGLIAGGEEVPLPLRRLLILETARLEDPVPAPWLEVLGSLIAEDSELLEEAVETAAALRLSGLNEQLEDVLDSASLRTTVRLRALEAMARVRPELPGERTDFLLQALETEQGPERIRIGRLLAAAGPYEPAQLDRFVVLASQDSALDPSLVLEVTERSGHPPSPALLEYLSRRVEAGWMPDRESVLRLAKRAPPADRERVDRLVESLDQVSKRRDELWAEYEPLLTGGDARRGREVFFGPAGCAACHRAEGKGAAGGPDLSRIGLIRDGDAILRSLLFPAATRVQGYEAWVVRTRDGRSEVGMLEGETAEALLLRDVTGRVTRLARVDVESAELLSRSLMPEGLLASLDEEEVRGLLAYLLALQ